MINEYGDRISLKIEIYLTIDNITVTLSGSETDINFSEFYYSFDGMGSVIVDDSGNGHDALPISVSRVAGKVGGAIKFLGEGSVPEIGDPNSAFPQDEYLTFMAWIKTEHNFTLREQLVGGWTGGAPGAFYPIANFGISFIDDRISFEVPSYPGMTSLTSDQLPIVPHEWFHIGVTYNGHAL